MDQKEVGVFQCQLSLSSGDAAQGCKDDGGSTWRAKCPLACPASCG